MADNFFRLLSKGFEIKRYEIEAVVYLSTIPHYIA